MDPNGGFDILKFLRTILGGVQGLVGGANRAVGGIQPDTTSAAARALQMGGALPQQRPTAAPPLIAPRPAGWSNVPNLPRAPVFPIRKSLYPQTRVPRPRPSVRPPGSRGGY